LWQNPVVGVEKEQPVIAGQGDPSVPGRAHSALLWLAYYSNTRISLDKACGYDCCSVSRAVVNDDRLPALMGLGKERLKRLGNCFRCVISWYDDRYVHKNLYYLFKD
jgi:hypothetical protein